MKPEDKQLAEQVLNHLCQDGQISGIRFGPILQLALSRIYALTSCPPNRGKAKLHISIEDSKKNLRGKIYLNLASKWKVFESLPNQLPQDESDFPETTVDEDLHRLCEIREAQISKVELGNICPHLLFHFVDGRILYVNGHSNGYESWDLGHGSQAKETWLVVATADDTATVFAPEDFIRSSSSRFKIYEQNGVKMISVKAINSESTITQRLDS
jgi:hypothetical protein